MKPLIGIIGGRGEMGKYFTDFFERNGYKVIVSGRKTELSNIGLAKKADVVIVSVPIGATEKVISQVVPYIRKNALLMDFTSLKVFPMEAMKKSKSSYLGCHPLFGPTTSIEGQMVVLCKGRGDKWYNWWKDLLLKNKVDVKELSAEKHDKLMAYIQSLTHFSYLALADVLQKSGLKISDILEYQSPIYRLRLDVMGRILNQDPNLYAQIQIQNPDSLKVMEDLMSSSKEWVEIVRNKNLKKFEKRFVELSDYFGNFKRIASEESDFLIEQMNRKKLAENVISEHRKPDKSYDLVALGPENTFSSLAAKKYDPKAKIWHADSISEVFEIVGKGLIKKGIVPIENKMSGTVAETSDNLFESNVKIQEEFNFAVHHCLAALSKSDLRKIQTIYSHSQPLRQCRKYLRKHFPKAVLVAMPSTASALKKVVSDNLHDAAVICSAEAAKDFQMSVLANKIEDFKSNTTRFLVIGKTELPIKPNRKYRTSIAFYFSADAPGTLYQVLGEFASAKVNMTRIESSANPNVPGGHVFYIDFEGSTDKPNVKKMLSGIRKHIAKLKILGCYSSA